MKIDKDKLGLAFKPRPVVLITTMDDEQNINAAPYSFIGPVSTSPPLISVSMKESQQTYKNILLTKKFVVNFTSKAILKQSIDCENKFPNKNKLSAVELDWEPSEIFKYPKLKKANLVLECKFYKELDISNSHNIIIAEIVSAEDLNDVDFCVQFGWSEFSSCSEIIKIDRQRKHI
jgi:flavin reductase (DIM6/NTAB) family NADH-FMN oxidoreductase RutF